MPGRSSDEELPPGARRMLYGPGLTRRRFVQVAALSAGFVAAGATLGRSVAKADGGGFQPPLSFDSASVPFSFVYGGQPSSVLLPSWTRSVQVTSTDSVHTTTLYTWTSPPAAGAQLQVQCEVTQYTDYPTTEWVLWFTNLGTADSPQLQKVLALDTWVQRTASQQFLVHANAGSTNSGSDFGPQDYLVEPADSWRLFYCTGGWSTGGSFNSDTTSALVGGGWPYFNVDLGDGNGFILALGWPGQWSVEMRREGNATRMHLLGGMNSTDTFGAGDYLMENTALLNASLHAGERIRTPRIVIQSWSGSGPVAAQNTWRAWMYAHNAPLVLGAAPLPIGSTLADLSFLDSISDELTWLNATIAQGVPAALGGSTDYWWRDAGWYDTYGHNGPDDWRYTGTWTPDPVRYPSTAGTRDGLSPMTGLAHQNGMRSIVWFEPERVAPGSELANDHPEWLLTASGGPWSILNLGNPDALSWAVGRFGQLISQNGVDIFREDHNYQPLPAWNSGDTPGRSGMTQALHVTGLISFWSQIQSLRPGLIIDQCTRRNDLEAVRHGVILQRSDGSPEFDPASQQAQTFGMAQWLPYYGTGEFISYPSNSGFRNDYVVRSAFCPALTLAVTSASAPATDWETFLRLSAEWAEIAPNLTGDYYPLTSCSLSESVWLAMQFDRPGIGEGVVLAYRRPSNGAATLTLSLSGIDTSAGSAYEVENFYAGTVVTMSGSALASLTVALDAGTGTAIRYRKVLPYATVIQQARPSGWWRLGDAAGSSSVADASGNGLAGTASGVSFGAAGAIAGDASTAAGFNGSSSYINIGNASQLQLSACSVEAWVNTTDTSHGGHAVCIKWYAWGLFLGDGVPALWDWSTSTRHQCPPAASVADGQWHHVVLTVQSGVANGTKIYVDGVLRLVTTVTVLSNAHEVIIGAGNIPATTDWYAGSIDEVAIYPRVLTGAQIQAHYRAGHGS